MPRCTYLCTLRGKSLAGARTGQTGQTCPGASLQWSLPSHLPVLWLDEHLWSEWGPSGRWDFLPGLCRLCQNQFSDIPEGSQTARRQFSSNAPQNQASSSVVPGCVTRELQLPNHSNLAVPTLSIYPMGATACHSYRLDDRLAFI